MLHSFLVNDSEMTAGTTSEVSQSSVSKQGMLYYEDIQWFSQFSVVSLYFFFVLLLLCSLLLHYISKWNPCQATLTIEIIRGQKSFFDTCGFILSYFKFGDFITLLWKIQYISNDTHSKGWLIFFFLSKQMELLEVLKSHQVMLNVERTAVKRYILLQVISQKYSKSFLLY